MKMTKSPDAPTKQRVTFYAPQTVLDIIAMVKEERNDDSVTDAVCQIVIEYGTRREMREREGQIQDKFAALREEMQDLKSANDVLKDRLEIVETKYANMNRAFAEIQSISKRS